MANTIVANTHIYKTGETSQLTSHHSFSLLDHFNLFGTSETGEQGEIAESGDSTAILLNCKNAFVLVKDDFAKCPIDYEGN